MKSLFTFCGKHGQILFILSLLVIFYFFDFHIKIFQLPHGIHFMRQTDCLSFVSNYYSHGFDFFSPQLFTLYNHEGKAVCEFPVLYYVSALLCLIAYEPVVILKTLTLSIVMIGFLYLFKLLKILFRSSFYAWVFTLLYCSSTILLYYSVNVLPDPSAMGFTLIGWYHVFNFKNRPYAHAWAFGLFTLASLLKVTMFIYPLAACLFLYISKKPAKNHLRWFMLSLIAVVGWNIFIFYYNSQNNARSFLLNALPIWNMAQKEIDIVIDHVFNYWHSEYYYQTTQHLFFILVMLNAAFIRRTENKLLFLSLSLILGIAAFILLFFPQFKDHDYYFLTVLPGLILVVAIAFITIQKVIPITLNTWLVKGIFALICFLSLNFAGRKLQQREQRPADEYSAIATKLAHAHEVLDSLKIPKTAKILIYPDYTPNGGLFMINRPGWGISDTESFRKVIDQVEYIILLDTSENHLFSWNKSVKRKHYWLLKM